MVLLNVLTYQALILFLMMLPIRTVIGALPNTVYPKSGQKIDLLLQK